MNFILMRRSDFQQILLVDNHAPHGYHIHDNPDDPKDRKLLNVDNPFAAMDLFLERVKEFTYEK